MARNSSILSVTVLGDTSRLKRSMADAARSVQGLEKSIAGSTAGIRKLFAGIGLGVGIQQFVKMGQAAAQDAASFRLMEVALTNATGATKAQIDGSEALIQSLSNQYGILDDDLRPALSVLASTYGSLEEAQAAMIPTLDLAAYAQTDARSAAEALAKAHKGNYKQLYSLIPALRGVADPMAKLQELTKGSAEAAANSDPFKKLQVIFDNLQETIGQYLLPYIQQFTDWLNTPQGNEQMKAIADAFGRIAVFVFNIISWLSNNFWLAASIYGLAKFIKIWWALFKVVQAVKKATKELTVVQAIATAMKGAMGPAGVALAIASGLAVAGAIAGSNLLFNDSAGSAPVIDPFNPTAGALPTALDPKLPTTKTGTASKVIKKTTDDLKKAIKTLQGQLASVRAIVKEFADKFRNAVEVSFGIVDRATGKMFRADRYVRELKRMRQATADFQQNLAMLATVGGTAATPLINQILGMSPEEGAAVVRDFAKSPALFQEAIALTNSLAATGGQVGVTASTLAGNPGAKAIVDEIKLLRADLAGGKNTYNIKGTMTANEIIAAIRTWEKSNGKRVLVG